MSHMTPNDWILSSDTGTSSKTIFACMTGSEYEHADVPHDPSDFGRCYRLLNHFPHWHSRLNEVAKKYPIWGPMVSAWAELTALYEKELPTGECPMLYKRMKALIDDGRRADGWIEGPVGCWRKNKHDIIELPTMTIRT